MSVPRSADGRARRRSSTRCVAAGALSGILLAAGAAPHLRFGAAPAYVPEGRLVVPRRRDLLQVTSAGLLAPTGAMAEGTQKLASAWTASEGTSFLSNFNEKNYGAMRDDTKRTPAFIKAIRQRLAGKEGKATFVDIGTGPFALFALVAARAGAKKVYAIEANPEAAERARAFVAKATDIAPGQVEVIEGFTTAVSLPEKVDYCVAEVIGVIGSEENAISTIRDAQARFMKNPSDPYAYIPHRVQTYAAPCSFALHREVLAPPRYEKLRGVPLRVNCRDKGVQILSDPKIIEDFTFDNCPPPGKMLPSEPVMNFGVQAARLEASEAFLYESLLKEAKDANGNPDDPKTQSEARSLAKLTANSFSGMAFWPKLILDPAGELAVDSRGPLGEPQKSHWQTLVSLMTPVPVDVQAGDNIQVRQTAELARDVTTPVKYTISAEIQRGAAAV